MTKPSKGMEALQARVADRIIRKNQSVLRTTSKLVRMRPDFKLEASKCANKEGVSFESFVRLAMADKMNWEGEL